MPVQPTDAKALAARVLSTVYMGTENSGDDTRRRAAALASEIGASHLAFDIDGVIAALVALFVSVTKQTPRFKVRVQPHAARALPPLYGFVAAD